MSQQINLLLPELRPRFDWLALPVESVATLEQATQLAFAHAQSGDVVLLSPACASLDMFRNYAHRAEVFIAEARAIETAFAEGQP